MAAATWPMVSDFDMTDSRLGLRVNSKSSATGSPAVIRQSKKQQA